MKQKDIALIAVVAVISAVISFVVSGAVIAPSKGKQQAEVVQPITSQFSEPDKTYFNSQSFDPTKQITIGQDANTNPFSSTTQ